MNAHIEKLAKDYAEYQESVSEFGEYGSGCADYTPKGKKSASTKKYNKFADACDDAGMSLKERNVILEKYYSFNK